jgi:1-pyrroline-5-carboxylate dehydrogenase
MLGQSKNVFQAEIDGACELIDFWRLMFTTWRRFIATSLLHQRVYGTEWNTGLLKGSCLPLLRSILLPLRASATAPAMMGNVAVWKPSNTQIYSARVIMEVLKEAGLPDGVINLVYVSGPEAGKVIFFLILILPGFILPAQQQCFRIYGKPSATTSICTNPIPVLSEKQEVRIL